RRLAPWRLRVVALRAAFAAAVRMVDRVHCDAADRRAPAEPTHASGLAVRDVLVLEVADLTDRRPARGPHAAKLARRHLQERVVALLRHQLDLRPGRAPDLSAAPLAELDVVHDRTEGDVRERQAVARLD